MDLAISVMFKIRSDLYPFVYSMDIRYISVLNISVNPEEVTLILTKLFAYNSVILVLTKHSTNLLVIYSYGY